MLGHLSLDANTNSTTLLTILGQLGAQVTILSHQWDLYFSPVQTLSSVSQLHQAKE